MQLNHYPAAMPQAVRFATIAQAAQRVNEIDSQIMAVQHLINREEGNADRVSAFEIDLKNDTQRKARRFEVLLINHEYQTAVNTLIRLTADKANALAHLEYLRNQFTVAKLEARNAMPSAKPPWGIAQQLTDFESRELVGL